MADDARISTALPEHPKTVKLRRRLGDGAGWSLICLFLFAAGNRFDGDLSGMSNEDIEIAAKWSGAPGAFVAALVEVRFLDGEEGSYQIHDWEEHNPWAASKPQRVEAAKEANRIRWERERQAKGIRTASEPDTSRTKAESPSSPPLPSIPNQKIISSNEKAFDDSQPKSSKASPEEAEAVKAVWNYYLKAVGRNEITYSFTPLRKRKGLARLGDALKRSRGDIPKARELLLLAVNGMCASDWHMGRDPKTNGKRYVEWEEHLFKSTEQLERWWARNDENN